MRLPSRKYQKPMAPPTQPDTFGYPPDAAILEYTFPCPACHDIHRKTRDQREYECASTNRIVLLDEQGRIRAMVFRPDYLRSPALRDALYEAIDPEGAAFRLEVESAKNKIKCRFPDAESLKIADGTWWVVRYAKAGQAAPVLAHAESEDRAWIAALVNLEVAAPRGLMAQAGVMPSGTMENPSGKTDDESPKRLGLRGAPSWNDLGFPEVIVLGLLACGVIAALPIVFPFWVIGKLVVWTANVAGCVRRWHSRKRQSRRPLSDELE